MKKICPCSEPKQITWIWHHWTIFFPTESSLSGEKMSCLKVVFSLSWLVSIISIEALDPVFIQLSHFGPVKKNGCTTIVGRWKDKLTDVT